MGWGLFVVVPKAKGKEYFDFVDLLYDRQDFDFIFRRGSDENEDTHLKYRYCHCEYLNLLTLSSAVVA